MTEPVALRPHTANPDVVEALETLLEQARAGEIIAIAYVADARTTVPHGYPGYWRDRFALMGQLLHLANHISKDAREGVR
jgi:hypothetical protein